METKQKLGLLLIFGVLGGMLYYFYHPNPILILKLALGIIVVSLIIYFTYSKLAPKEKKWKLSQKFGSVMRGKKKIKSSEECLEKAREFLKSEGCRVRVKEGNILKVHNKIVSPSSDPVPVALFQLLPSASFGEYPESGLNKEKMRTVAVDMDNLNILFRYKGDLKFYPDPTGLPDQFTAVGVWQRLREAGMKGVRKEKTAVEKAVEDAYQKELGSYIAEKEIKGRNIEVAK